MRARLHRGRHALEEVVGLEIDRTSAALANDPELMRQLFGDEMAEKVAKNLRRIEHIDPDTVEIHWHPPGTLPEGLRGLEPTVVEMDGFPATCYESECGGRMIKTIDDFKDARADMRDHYAVHHPGKKNPHA